MIKFEQTRMINGKGIGSDFGSFLSKDDMNNDGIADLIVGERSSSISNNGFVYIYWGAKSTPGSADASAADLIIEGAYNGSTAGDFNNDGTPDLIVGANTGAYIFFGGNKLTGKLKLQEADVFIENEPSGLGQTTIVSSAGDFNNDSIDDVMVGNYLAGYDDGQGYRNQGRVYIFFGSTTPVKKSNAASADIMITGEQTHSYFGQTIANAGDFNGDRISDILVGSSRYKGYSGRAYIFLGKPYSNKSITANEADIIIESVSSTAQMGISVAGKGNVNGDDKDDIIIGSAFGGDKSQGQAYVFYGRDPFDKIYSAYDSDIIYTGDIYPDLFGARVCFTEDLNSDGFDDIAITATQYKERDNIKRTVGAAYLFYSKPASLKYRRAMEADAIFTGTSRLREFGASVCSCDLNLNGTPELIIGDIGAMNVHSACYFFEKRGIQITKPAKGSILNGKSENIIEWQVENLSNLKHMILLYSIDGGKDFNEEIATVDSGIFVYTWRASNVTSTRFILKIQAIDLSNKIISEDISDLVVDSTPPVTFDLRIPIDNSYESSQPTLRWSNSQDYETDILQYDVYLDDAFYMTVSKSQNAIVITHPLPDGKHKWTVIALNKVLLATKASQNGSFVIDSKKPIIKIISPKEKINYAGNVPFIITFSDSGSGIANSTIYCDGKKIFAIGTSLNLDRKWDVNNIPEGSHLIEIISVDKAGNSYSVFLDIVTSIYIDATGEIQNGGFELKDFTSWEIGTGWDLYGSLQPTQGRLPQVINYKPHTDFYSAIIGGPPLTNSGAGPFCSWISQTIQMPSNIISAKLSFWKWCYSDNYTDIQKAYYKVDGASVSNTLFEVTASDREEWEECTYTLPINMIRGKKITLFFEVVVMAGGNNSYMFVDDIELSAVRSETSVEGHMESFPSNLYLFQNFPNPFNSQTTFSYALPKNAHVSDQCQLFFPISDN